MLEGVKGFFRSRALAKYASTEPTRITPIGKIRSAVAFIDVEDTSFNECKVALMNFFRERNIKGDIFFFDFRKLTEGERLITSITTTVLRKDLNWYGRPAREKVDLMLEGEPDMFISLLRKSDFPIHFMAAASKAHFKVMSSSPIPRMRRFRSSAFSGKCVNFSKKSNDDLPALSHRLSDFHGPAD